MIKVFVNGQQLTNPSTGDHWAFEKTGGGYTDNYITLFGSRQLFDFYSSSASHTFDNFTVWSAPATAIVPEPTTSTLALTISCVVSCIFLYRCQVRAPLT